MKLYTKLMLGFGSLWVVFLVATIVAMSGLQQNGAALEVAFHSNFDSVVYCDRMKTSLDDINRVILSAVWIGSNPPSKVIEASWENFRVGKDGQRRNISLPGEAELTAKLFDLADNYYGILEKFTAGSASQWERIYRDEALPGYVATRDAAQAIVDLNLNHLLMVEAQLRGNLASVRHVQIIFVIAGGAFAAFCVFVLAKTILGPLQVLTHSARQIESGDLDLLVPVSTSDELGELAAAFNAMAAKLREYRQLDHARLLRTQQTTQLAIDSLPDAVVVFNPSGEVEIANRQARLHFGLEPGKKQNDSHFQWLTDLFTGPLSTGQPIEPLGYRSAVQLFDKGEERFLLPRSVPMLDAQGEVIGVVVILVDVTRLHHADELKSGLVATTSHELKTPLAATRFSVQLLTQETVGPLNHQQRRLVLAACDGADRLNRIIENLLQIQRIDEGGQAVRLVAMAPSAIIEQVVEPLRGEFDTRGLKLTTQVPGDLPDVLADPDLVGYVLNNLLTNALKFVPGPGRVDVSAGLESDGLHFMVTDDGPGISEEHLPKLFHRFYRANAPRAVPGAGLGLAIARQMVEAQGGRIFASNRTKGATFTFVLKTTHQIASKPA